MLYRNICKILGNYLFGLTIALLVPFFLAIYYQYKTAPDFHPQPHSVDGFLWSIVVTGGIGFICYIIGRRSSGQMYRREGIVSVVMIWFLTPALAGLPFLFSGTFTDPFHAYFEATSGFTTTGSTCMQAKKYNPETGEEIQIKKVVYGAYPTEYTFWGTIEPVRNPETGEITHEGIEAVSKALLFWRSLTQWLGGMGIVVLFVAILPALGVGGKVLFQAEVPGPIKDSLTPRIKETAIHLWKIYVGISIIQVILLMLTNAKIGVYDAITITFGTMSTGGLSTKNASIGFFNNPYTDWIVIIFMFLGSINFSLYFYALRGKLYRMYEPEFFLFLAIVIFSCGFSAWYIVGSEKILMTGEPSGVFNIGEAIRHGSFQIISGMSTTGFATTDYNIWPYAVQALMIILMFIGGMSGSTSGGMKVVRLFMIFKVAQHKIESLFHPESVRSFKIGDKEIDMKVALTVLVFFVTLIAMSTLGAFLFILDGIDLETAFSLVTLHINNIGMGFRMASPKESCAFLSDFGVVLASLLMLFGRLEFLVVLAILVPAFWKQN
jgi:trk system potassium uptake protein TrkH